MADNNSNKNKQQNFPSVFNEIKVAGNYLGHAAFSAVNSAGNGVINSAVSTWNFPKDTLYHYFYTFPKGYIDDYKLAESQNNRPKMQADVHDFVKLYVGGLIPVDSEAPGIVRAMFANNELNWNKKSHEFGEIFEALPSVLEYAVHNPEDVFNRIMSSLYDIVKDPDRMGNLVGNIFLLVTAPTATINAAQKIPLILEKSYVLADAVLANAKVRIGSTIQPYFFNSIIEWAEHTNVSHSTYKMIKAHIANKLLKLMDFEDSLKLLLGKLKPGMTTAGYARILREFNIGFSIHINKFFNKNFANKSVIDTYIEYAKLSGSERKFFDWELSAARSYKNINPKFKHLTEEEIISIYIYTSKEFTGINLSLREPSSHEGELFSNRYKKIIAHIRSGMDKLPQLKFGTDTYRGSNFFKIDENGYLIDKAFGSVSTNANISMEFKGDYFYIIRNAKGAYIDGFSQYMGEEEVLLSPGYKLKSTGSIDLNDKRNEELLENNTFYQKIKNSKFKYIKIFTME